MAPRASERLPAPPEKKIGSQCINCGLVEIAREAPVKCGRCGGFELHLWPA